MAGAVEEEWNTSPDFPSMFVACQLVSTAQASQVLYCKSCTRLPQSTPTNLIELVSLSLQLIKGYLNESGLDPLSCYEMLSYNSAAAFNSLNHYPIKDSGQHTTFTLPLLAYLDGQYAEAMS
jgi:hypothetical protein